jgi:hypothetical protein
MRDACADVTCCSTASLPSRSLVKSGQTRNLPDLYFRHHPSPPNSWSTQAQLGLVKAWPNMVKPVICRTCMSTPSTSTSLPGHTLGKTWSSMVKPLAAARVCPPPAPALPCWSTQAQLAWSYIGQRLVKRGQQPVTAAPGQTLAKNVNAAPVCPLPAPALPSRLVLLYIGQT